MGKGFYLGLSPNGLNMVRRRKFTKCCNATLYDKYILFRYLVNGILLQCTNIFYKKILCQQYLNMIFSNYHKFIASRHFSHARAVKTRSAGLISIERPRIN